MDPERISNALAHATDTRHVVIAPGAAAQAAEVFAREWPGQPAVIVADETTYEVAGRGVHESLRAHGIETYEPFVFPLHPSLHAEYPHMLELEAALGAHTAIPVAVGSGTINDLCKLAAHRTERTYMVVATAASMDGYTAFGAAITRDGYKQTMTCRAPRALIADLDILRAAPYAMTAAGYADLLGKITAGADWLVADALGIEPLHEGAWELIQGSLREWTARSEALRAGEPEAFERLIEGLVMCGLAMQEAQSSRPASGSEHLLSHLWEMEGLTHAGEEVPHGFKVGLGSIAIAALYEKLLQADLTQLDRAALARAWPSEAALVESVREAHSVPAIAENAVTHSRSKYINAEQLTARLDLLRERWPDLRARLRTQLMTADEIRALLQAAGAPTAPADIGLDLPRLRTSYARARQIRARYTVLDLAFETGLLGPCVDALFAPGGFWE